MNLNEMLQQVFSIKNIIIYLVVMNAFGFFIMWLDKRKAQRSKWRIKESTLFLITALGGGIGTIAGMYTFRHKTQKARFVFGFPAIVVIQIIVALMIIFKI